MIKSRITDNKKLIDTANHKIYDIEKSQKFICDKYDAVNQISTVNKGEMVKLQGEIKSMGSVNKKLKSDNEKLSEDIIDLQCRSMRDNMVILGLSESSNIIPVNGSVPYSTADPSSANPTGSSSGASIVPMDTSTAPFIMGGIPSSYAATVSSGMVSCTDKVYQFCENVLNINDPRSKIEIDRAHRMGAPGKGKRRPVVVEFKDTDSKTAVKSSLKMPI